MTTSLPIRVPVVGVPISVTTVDSLLELLADRQGTTATTVAFCNVHSVMTARGDPEVAAALQNADVAAPDGMPIVWGLRLAGLNHQSRVDGPSFLPIALRYGLDHGWRHFFFGSTPDTLEAVISEARRVAPGVLIAGSHSPPFRTPTDQDIADATHLISASEADLVWVGLGMPKQEIWMQRARSMTPGVALLGVGAAFDFLAGRTRRAPRWMQSTGLEWAHRLAQEPKRLWRRYVINNPAYVSLLAREVILRKLGRRRA